jgi:hypothetical protein
MNTPANKQVLWVAIFALVVAAAVGVNSIIYANSVARQSNRNWCSLLELLITPQPSTPPQTPQEVRGRQITDQIRRLYQEFGCGQQ